MSKKITIGKVAITPKGRWNGDVVYEKLDAVLHDGAMWLATEASIGEAPSESSPYWKIAAEGAASSWESSASGGAPLVFLPDHIYVAKGRTIEIYDRQVCPDADKYNFKWSCSIGKAYDRKFSVTGISSQAGRSYPLTLEIFDAKGNVVWNKTVSVDIVEMDFLGKKYICPIGDMHTDGKVWIDEVALELSEDMIGFIGSFETESGYFHEGRSGWSTDVYLEKSESTNISNGENMENPFWDDAFSWSYYLDSCEDWPDAVQLFFGERELYSVSAETFANNLARMVDMIKSDSDEDIPVFIVLPPCPGPQDGIAELTASDKTVFNGRSKYEADRIFIEAANAVYEKFNTDDYTNVYFIPLVLCHDSENNYPTNEIAVNPRSTETHTICSDALHPTDAGYKQMADVMFGVYCAALNG